MFFEARITKDGKGYRVRFPALENVVTYALSLKDARVAAQEALIGCLSEDLDRGLDLPAPLTASRRRRIYLIPIPLQLSAALLFRRLRRTRGWTTRDVAKRLGVSRQAYEKLESGRENPSVATLERTMAVFGKRLDLLIRPLETPGRQGEAA